MESTCIAVSELTPQSNSLPKTGMLPQVAVTQSLSKRLQRARKKLQEVDNPDRLKFVSYLRMSCAVMQKIHPEMLEDSVRQTPKITYLGLMQALLQYNPEWYKSCKPNALGILESDDIRIEELLQPITFLHQIFSL